MASIVSQITVVIVNHETKKLVQTAIKSFLKCYSGMPMIVFDNGSRHDDSAGYLARLARKHSSMRFIGWEENIGHGPALHHCTMEAKTRFVFALDSDTRTDRGGFLETMLGEFDKDKLLFAIGWLRRVNEGGVAYKNPVGEEGHEYIHPSVMLFDREKYLGLKPFVHAGAPAIATMITAKEQGYHLKEFRISDYITHFGWGTRRIYGGKWDPRATAGMTPAPWDPKSTYPI